MSSVQRDFVFIDSSNPTIHHQVIDGSRPNIKLPFPPNIDPFDLVVKSRNGKIPARVPNPFIIYLKVYSEAVRNEGYIFPMTITSSMASQSWERESKTVKEEYKRLAKEALEVRNEMLPKANRRRKRERWNIVSFGKSNRSRNNKSPILKTQKPASEVTDLNSGIGIIQPPTPITSPKPDSISSPNPVNGEFNPVSPTFTQYTQYPSPKIPDMFSTDSIDFNNQLPSPGSSSPEINDYCFPETSSNNSIETPILYEEELFDLLAPINNDIRTGQLEIFGGEGFTVNPFVFSTAVYGESRTYGSETFENFNTEPSSGLDLGYSYYF